VLGWLSVVETTYLTEHRLKHTLFSVLIAVGLAAFLGLTRWQTLSEDPLIMTDGQGYYAYLPAVFIYHDLSLQFVWTINETYYEIDKRAPYVNHTPDGVINKYFVGTSILQAPFFLLAHAYAKAFNHPADGYSKPYQISVGVAALFYLCLGVWFLAELLIMLGFTQFLSLFTVFTIVFGTNLLHYSIYEPSMSHVYSFCTISGLLFFGINALSRDKMSSWFGVATALALTILIRPTNGIVFLALAAVAPNKSQLWNSLLELLRAKKILIGSLLIGIAILSIQPIIYYVQTGHPWIWSYGEEGFDFSNPKIGSVLFGYRKGLFVYAPLLFLGVVGLLVGIRKNAFRYMWLLGTLCLVTWIISSWWMWYYGGSFGHRAFIEYLPLFAIGLACVIRDGVGFIKPKLIMVLCSIFVALSLFQTYQYRMGILPYDEITKEKYWNLFLLTGDDLQGYYSPGERDYIGADSMMILNDFENDLNWDNGGLAVTEQAKSGTRSAKMTGDSQYGPTYRQFGTELPDSFDIVRVVAWIKSNRKLTKTAFVCSLQDSTGAAYYWSSYPVRPQLNIVGWSKVEAVFKCGEMNHPTDRVVIHPMKMDNATVFVDDMEIRFIHEK